MIFLDTNIWIDLLAVTSSDKEHENIQIQKASSFLKSNTEEIITCREQQIEMINAIQKIKRRECNRKLKAAGLKGIGSTKEFRKHQEFNDAITLCKSVYEDMQHLATIDNNFSYDVKDIINHLCNSDINDYMYLSYCIKNNIKLYTFDKELADSDKYGNVILL